MNSTKNDKSDLIKSLTADELKELLSLGRHIFFQAKDFIFRKYDTNSNFYFIKKGRVAIITFSVDGRDMFLNFLEAGEGFGEIAAIDQMPRTATAQATTESELISISRENFLHFLRGHPNLAIKLLELLCQRMRWSTYQIENSVFLSMTLRLARALSHMARRYGEKHSLGTKITMYLPQERLASLIGSTRESVNKFLRDLEKKGLIHCIKRDIIVPDVTLLETVTEENFLVM